MAKNQYDFILCDIKMPDMDGLQVLEEIKKRGLEVTVIMMSAYGTIETAIEAMKLGAYDYVSKPFKKDEIVLALKKAEERERLKKENLRLQDQVEKKYSFESIIAKSDKMQDIFQIIKKVADYDTTVLISGESGVGKELIAQAVHYNSKRKDKPFVGVNCGAIPENLLESELFGYVRGAFTDAAKDKKGLFEEAEGGTLFLDEIGELPKDLQVKLLRVLQEEEIRRLGDTKIIKMDVRIIAATLKELSVEVRERGFREDLFYRLNVMPIHIPPLRERREDIPLLAEHFFKKHTENLGKTLTGISPKAMECLIRYPWPGNVRELENVIERSVILEGSDGIQEETLSLDLGIHEKKSSISGITGGLSLKVAQRVLEEEMIKEAMKETHGNRSKAARLLEISYRALLYKIKDYGLDD
jgi:two-component system response regulator AtoC